MHDCSIEETCLDSRGTNLSTVSERSDCVD